MPKFFELIQSETPKVRLNICALASKNETVVKLRDHILDAVLHHERYDNLDLQHEVVIRHQPVIIARRDHPRIGDTASKQAVMQEKIVRVAGMHGSPGIVDDNDEAFQFVARKPL
ncbi:hypothetical protein F6R98_06875 [Candidatus Methylospira mobilis]|uniref:LysR substrate-binding domain-containing protein n=1 Tax=Candidatus Methylospira mobilis TaxID=1808979 RepID=A0A5Q0BJM2_9GAMM|nr:hypothetical protein [Candidatus Methylospira mobilis]QFY42384.1 hypothetical protein F6R98_06875 [Candidatus Methylospira mobilis]WNV04516.1 hypothetical protein RP726_19300 [Candidatus Methylospira mobilis]